MAAKRPQYGRRHREARLKIAPVVEAGQTSCSRCGKQILPGELWDLDHLPGGGPRDYAGPAHQSCNRRTAAHRKERERRQPNPSHAGLEAKPWAAKAKACGATVWSQDWYPDRTAEELRN